MPDRRREARPDAVQEMPHHRLREELGGGVGGGLRDRPLPGAILAYTDCGFRVYFGCRRAVLAVAARHGLRPLGPAQRLPRHVWRGDLGRRAWIDLDDGASWIAEENHVVDWEQEEGGGWRPVWREVQRKAWRLVVAPERFRTIGRGQVDGQEARDVRAGMRP